MRRYRIRPPWWMSIRNRLKRCAAAISSRRRRLRRLVPGKCFLASGAWALGLSVPLFAVFGGVALAAEEMDGYDLRYRSGWIPTYVIVAGVVAVIYGGLPAFCLGGGLGLLLRRIVETSRSEIAVLILGAAFGAVAASVATAPARCSIKTDPRPSTSDHAAADFPTQWIFWGSVNAGVAGGGWIAFRICRARRGEFPADEIADERDDLKTKGFLTLPPCLLLSYGIFYLLWRTVPLYYEFRDL